MNVTSLVNMINTTTPYAWDDSLGVYEFLGKIVSKLNEVVDEVNLKLPDGFELAFYEKFREYTTEEIAELVSSGEFETMITNILTGVNEIKDEIIDARGGEGSVGANIAGRANGDVYRFTNGGTSPQQPNIIKGYAGNVVASDLNQCIIGGGGGNNASDLRENVIGGNTANVNTPLSNADPMELGTGANLARILGGYDNVCNALTASINGDHCIIEKGATHSAINGGASHKILLDSNFASIGGGLTNTVSEGNYGTIGGGVNNIVTKNYPTVGGGSQNKANGIGATVSGGGNNEAQADFASVGGGYMNKAVPVQSTVAGGQKNVVEITAPFGTIVGGFENTVTGSYATIVGGMKNIAGGLYSSVVNGESNSASSSHSTVMGKDGYSTYTGENVLANGKFAVQGDAQKSELVVKKQTIDAVKSYLNAGANYTFTVPADSTWGFKITVVARRTDVDGESAMFEIKGLAQRGTGGATLVGTPIVTEIAKTANANISAGVETNGGYALRFWVIGEAGKAINWVGNLEIIQNIG